MGSESGSGFDERRSMYNEIGSGFDERCSM